MGLKIASRLFSGPYDISKFKRRRNQTSVIYAVVSKSGPPWDPEHYLIDIGTHGDDGLDFAAVFSAADWEPINDGQLMLFVYFLENRRSTVDERTSIVARMRKDVGDQGAFIPIA